MVDYAKVHNELYRSIPSFECRDGCSDCCGPMPVCSPWEFERLPEIKLSGSSGCPFKQNGCTIYEHRMFLCRLFGNAEGFTCPHGCGPEKLLSREGAQELKLRYFELF